MRSYGVGVPSHRTRAYPTKDEVAGAKRTQSDLLEALRDVPVSKNDIRLAMDPQVIMESEAFRSEQEDRPSMPVADRDKIILLLQNKRLRDLLMRNSQRQVQDAATGQEYWKGLETESTMSEEEIAYWRQTGDTERRLVLLSRYPKLGQAYTPNIVRRMVTDLLKTNPFVVMVYYSNFKEYSWAGEVMLGLCEQSLLAALDFLTAHPNESFSQAMWDKALQLLEDPSKKLANEKLLSENPQLQALVEAERTKRKPN